MKGLKLLIAVGTVVACVALVGVGNALAVQQLTASGGAETGALRDNLVTPPSNGQYGADALLNNTTNPIRFSLSGTGVNSSPQYDAFLGLKLNSNPTAANCSVAGGYVEFADFQNSSPSDTFADTLIDPWRVSINSDSCSTDPDQVTVSGVGLYFPEIPLEVTGTVTGTYEEPGVNCPAGGIKLDVDQPGILVDGSAVAGTQIDDGTAGANAYLCLVSANNYVYPTSPAGLGSLTGAVTNN